MHYLFDKFDLMLLRSYFSVPTLKLMELGTAEKLSDAKKQSNVTGILFQVTSRLVT